MTHLQKNAALDLSQLNVDVTDVKFQGNEATAAVNINPKSAPSQGMAMSYTLQRRGDKWEVQGRGSGHGGAMGSMPDQGAGGAGALPPGHPPAAAGSEGSGSGTGALPPGHPPVNQPAPSGK